MSEIRQKSLKTVFLLTAIAAVLIFAVAGPAWAVEECVSNTLGYWHLEEDVPAVDATFADDVVGGTDGTCHSGNCPAPAAGALVGNTQVFNGTNDGIDIADPAATDSVFDWNGTDSFSISMWVSTAATISSNVVLVGRNPAGNVQWWVGLTPPGVARFYLVDSAGNGGGINGTTNIANDAWHLIVAVRDADNDLNIVYVDGVLQASEPGLGVYTGNFKAEASAVNFGHLNGTAFFAGALDEVGLYGRALSAVEAQQLYNYGFNYGHGYCNNLPDIDPIIGLTATENQALAATTATANDSDGIGDLPLTWGLTTGPTGMAIDSVTGAITWTPPDDSVTGDVDVTITATDMLGGVGSLDFTIAVTAINDAPQITGQATLTMDEDTDLTITLADLTVTDPDNTYPTGFTLTVQDGTNYTHTGAVITPDQDYNGTLTVPVSVNDGSDDSNVFNLQVTVNPVDDPTPPSSGGGGGGGGGCFIGTAGAGSNPATGMTVFGLLAAAWFAMVVIRFSSKR